MTYQIFIHRLNTERYRNEIPKSRFSDSAKGVQLFSQTICDILRYLRSLAILGFLGNKELMLFNSLVFIKPLGGS